MKKENIIFLDVDGPLMPSRQWLHPNNSALRREFAGDKLWFKKINQHPDFCERITFDAVACEMFNIWADMGNAKVVVASNWRNWLDKDQLETIFANNNMTFELHKDWRTGQKFTSNRIHEIGMWMTDYPDVNAIIVDDDQDLRRYEKWFEDENDKDDWMNRATLISPDYADGITSKLFNNGCKALGIDIEELGEKYLGVRKLTDEEKEQLEKDLELMMKCMI